MRVGIDARLALTNKRGHGRYICGLCKALLEMDDNNEYLLYVDVPDIDRVFSKYRNAKVRVLSALAYPFWEQWVFPRQLVRDRVDLVHLSNHTAPFRCPVPSVVTIFDTIYLEPSSRKQPLWQKCGRAYKRWTAPRSARYACKVITASEYGRDEIVKRLGIQAEKVAVTYMGVDPIFQEIPEEVARQRLRRLGIDKEPFLFCLGAFDPRKNTARVLQAYRALLGAATFDIKLAVGGLTREDVVSIFPEGKVLVSEGRIVGLGFVTDEDLVALYNLAEVFIYISRSEGFGLPVLEAMACGTPVVGSNRSSIPEIAGGAAMLVDPDSVREIAGTVKSLMADSSLRDHCRSAGKRRAQRFSWLEVARRTLQIYESVVQEITRAK